MANPSKARGTAGETATVKWLRQNGFGHADRQPLRGTRDQGDLTLCPGVIAEVKSYRLPTGTPTRGQLTEWLRQTEAERVNACADVAVLIVKRPGTTNVAHWHAYVTVWTILDVVGGTRYPGGSGHAPVCMALGDLVPLLRAAGWGDHLEQDGAA